MIRDTLHTAGELVALTLFCAAVLVFLAIVKSLG